MVPQTGKGKCVDLLRASADLWGVLLGGVLAIVGGFAGQWWAARQRREEANRERLERFRQDVTRAAVEAFEVIQQARPDALTLFGDHDAIRDRMRALNEREQEAGRLLMAVSVGRPGQDAEAVADAAEELRRCLRVTKGQSIHFAGGIISRSDHEPFDHVQKANDKARGQLDALQKALRDL